MESKDVITYDAVHLKVINLDRSIDFWTSTLGFVLRERTDTAHIGTESKTLIVLHQTATKPFQVGYADLYHLAVHFPTQAQFATFLNRLIQSRYPISPTDHIMSKAVYLVDPDGITLEFTLETPERFKGYSFEHGMFTAIDSQGNHRGVTEMLDVQEVLSHLNKNSQIEFYKEAYIGHVHLYVNNLSQAYEFYSELGFVDNMFSEQIGMADMSAGGKFTHRIAMNTWQSLGANHSPKDHTGLDHFELKLNSQELAQKLSSKAEQINAEKTEQGFKLLDPAGNQIAVKI